MDDEMVTVGWIVPAAIKAMIEELAKKEDRSASAVVRRILAAHFGESEPDNGKVADAPAAEADQEGSR